MDRREGRQFISEALRLARNREETESLLGDEEHADENGRLHETPEEALSPDPHHSLPVYRNIHR